jgi:hypothetical protein
VRIIRISSTLCAPHRLNAAAEVQAAGRLAVKAVVVAPPGAEADNEPRAAVADNEERQIARPGMPNR